MLVLAALVLYAHMRRIAKSRITWATVEFAANVLLLYACGFHALEFKDEGFRIVLGWFVGDLIALDSAALVTVWLTDCAAMAGPAMYFASLTREAGVHILQSQIRRIDQAKGPLVVKAT